MISPQTIRVVQNTAPVVAPLALQIVDTFYGDLFAKYPETKAMFPKVNQSKGIQQQSLADAVVAFATHIQDLSPLGERFAQIFHRHCGIDVQPPHYSAVHECLMGAIGKTLPKEALTDEVVAGWSDAVMSLAQICISEEEKLYKAADERGWRGFRSLKLIKKEPMADNVISFTFETERPVSWSAGQYITVRTQPKDGINSSWHPTAVRHYTCTSTVGENVLQCTTKRLPSGEVSSYMHSNLNVGDHIDVAIPFGTSTVIANKPYVLLSAGVGITSSVAVFRGLSAAGSKLQLAAHVDHSPDAHAFSTLMPKEKQFNTYTTSSGRIEPRAWVEDILTRVGAPAKKEAVFRVCGPPAWMLEVEKSLNDLGAAQVQTEFFGPKL
eukprot:GEMP01048529.1.p1 GENE.GEMP01048529.1~~GEMP01048529.1.p1  ORF type:complete len:381 (+),score=113.70 GEMP01048529.1:137-1279(+)